MGSRTRGVRVGRQARSEGARRHEVPHAKFNEARRLSTGLMRWDRPLPATLASGSPRSGTASLLLSDQAEYTSEYCNGMRASECAVQAVQ